MAGKVTYTEYILKLLEDSDGDIALQLIQEAEKIKSCFDAAKQQLNIEKASILLTTNWNDVNAQRVSEGLPKISNESMRKAYLDLRLEDKIKEVKNLETEYNTIERILNYYMEAL